MKKIILTIVVVIYLIITIFITTYLIKYNEFRISVFGGYTLIIPEEKQFNEYNKNQLLVVKNGGTLSIGDEVFFYNTSLPKVKINSSEVIKIEDDIITLKDDLLTNKEYLIGKKENVKEYAYLGSVIRILSSKYGYLFIVILPMILLFGLEIYYIVREIRQK